MVFRDKYTPRVSSAKQLCDVVQHTMNYETILFEHFIPLKHTQTVVILAETYIHTIVDRWVSETIHWSLRYCLVVIAFIMVHLFMYGVVCTSTYLVSTIRQRLTTLMNLYGRDVVIFLLQSLKRPDDLFRKIACHLRLKRAIGKWRMEKR